jgi:predicted phage terminase large subunit-like protein
MIVPDLDAARAERARRSLKVYLGQVWPIIEPARPLIPAWHLDAIAEHLQAVSKGQIKRLILCQPPGTGKSTLVGTAWPSWVWAGNPAWRLIGASYAHDLAVRDAMRMRDVVRSDWYQGAFVRGAWKIRDDNDKKDDYANSAGGHRLATSVGKGTTGWRADALLIDDAISAGDAYSKAAREECWRWFGSTMTSRLDDPANAAIVVVGQRLAVDDLPGRLMTEDGANWETLILPSEYDPRRSRVTCIGWKDPRTETDEPLFTAMYGKPVLAQARRDLGSAGYASQHDQNPLDETGGMFQRAWWRFHGTTSPRPEGCYAGPAVPLPKLDRVIVSVDCTFKKSDTSDYVAAQVWGSSGMNCYLLDAVRRRLSFTETLAMLRQLVARWPAATKVLVEAAANGEAVLDMLRGEVRGIVGVKATESKEARAAAVSPMVEAGQVHLPDAAPFLDDYVSELAAFPRGRHDDAVDSTSMALKDLAINPSFVGAIHLERGPFAQPRRFGKRDTFGRPIK